MKPIVCVVTGLILVMLAGCEPGVESPKGFSLPPGNPEAGKIAFVALNCNACHSVGDIAQRKTDSMPDISVRLGGPTTARKTYADLLTSVINPSHRLVKGYDSEMIQVDGESKMPNFNSIMTVSQLIDIVTFLETNYELQIYIPTQYPVIY